MFSILGKAVELLYGNNLGYPEDRSIYSLASHVLQVEQQLHEWKATLPSWLRPDNFETASPGSEAENALEKRFQSIVVVRYNYMRALIHRPMLVRLLQMAQDEPEGAPQDHLRDVGRRSLEACIDSSIELISCVYAVCRARAQKELLGTWWCSLYFSMLSPALPCKDSIAVLAAHFVTAFTAALNVFAACLHQIEHSQPTENDLRSPLQLIKSFRHAIRTLEILHEGNSAVAKCVSCLRNLELALVRLRKF
jgi:hypothetical protein